MSEAELHVLRARLRGGLINKARRGELRCRLPVGLVYDSAGRVALDPDKQVQESVRLFFQRSTRPVPHTQRSRPSEPRGCCFPPAWRQVRAPTSSCGGR